MTLGGTDETSVQDSSQRNDFNEYRDLLQSQTDNYSDQDFTTSIIESLNVSNAKQVVEEIETGTSANARQLRQSIKILQQQRAANL